MLNNEIFLNGLIIYVFSCDLFSLSDFLLVAEEKNRNVFPEAMSFLLNVTIEDEKCAKDNILHFVCSKKIVLVPYLIDSFYKQLAVIPEVVASSTRLFSESTLPKAMIATHIRKLGASIFPLISQMIQLKALMGTQALMFMEALIEKDTFCGFLGASCEHDLANAFAFCGDTFHSFFDKKEIFESSLEDKETFIFSLQSAAIKYHEEEIYHREINFFLTIKARFDIDFNQAKTMQEAIQMAARCESAIYALNLFFAGKYQITKEEFICFEKFYNHYKKINMKNSSRPRYQKPFEFFCSDFRLELQYLYFLMREQAFEFLRGFIASSVVGLDQFMRLIREMLNFISWSDKAFLAERRFIFSSGGFFDDGNHSEKKEFLESIMFLVIRDKSYIDEIEKIYFMHRLFSQKIATLDRLAAAFRRLRDGMGEIEGVRQIVIENLKSILNFFPTEKQITQIFSALLELEFLEVFSENSSLPAKQKFLSTVRPKYARTCLLDNIHQIMVALFIKEIQISPQCYKSKSDKISRGMLLSLLLGLWRTNGSGLGMLHRDLLRIFFEPEITFKQFVSNGVVDFPMSQCLSVYNKKIVEELEKHAIKTDFLLQYEKKSLFYAAKNKEQPREFFVEIWDKSQLGTFLLGKFVGCCLAPTGEYFYAIVQRCADIGMLFPVVIDQKSGEPIACNWAFFAKGNDEKIYLAINFFEIRANYARDGFLRNQIVDALFQFTQGYAGDVGVEAMLIRPLTYGNIPDFKGLPSRDLRIEKVGGFFKPTEYAADYYLDALACAQFYCVPAIRPPNVEVHLSGNNNGLFHHANQSSDNASHVEMSVVAPK